MYYYTDQKVLLRESMKMATIVKRLEDNQRYLVSYYDEHNKFKYKIITEMDIIDEEEYVKIKNRMDIINKLLDD